MAMIDSAIVGNGAVTIRPARTADLPELLRLIRAYYRFDHIRFEPRMMTRALGKFLRSGAFGRAWIMTDGPRSAGYVVLTYNYDLEFGGLEGLVTDLYICPAYRGSGLGRRALETVDDYCRSRRIGTVELQVEQDNVAAQAFYRKLGFRQLTRVVMTRKVRSRASQTPHGQRVPLSPSGRQKSSRYSKVTPMAM
jgi:ribosomal protein S18 acetylase RimI-like enzyme